jgi:RNA polymerase sigma-70 factor (ECF subfamily)
VTDLAASAQSEPGGKQATPDFSQIYQGHAGYVWNLLRRLGIAERDIEDAVHDVFLVVHRRLGEFDPTRPIRAWLGGIAVRVASDHRRRGYRRSEVVGHGAEAVETRPDPQGVLEEKQVRELVLSALSRVDASQRAVFVLHELEGYSIPEIARMVEAPVNTCYSRLRLGRGSFTAAVKRLCPTEVRDER